MTTVDDHNHFMTLAILMILKILIIMIIAMFMMISYGVPRLIKSEIFLRYLVSILAKNQQNGGNGG